MHSLTRREFTSGTIGALALSHLGCSGSQSSLIQALDVASLASNAAIPVIQAFSSQLGPKATTLALAYAQGIASASAQSVTELGNTADTQDQQYSAIAGYFVNVASLNLPEGTAAQLTTIISAIGAAVHIILGLVRPLAAPSPARSAPTSPDVQALLNQYQAQAKSMGSDKARIADILAHAPTQ